MIYILVRTHHRTPWADPEIVAVYRELVAAKAVVDKKNGIHESIQPYIYSVVKKKIK